MYWIQNAARQTELLQRETERGKKGGETREGRWKGGKREVQTRNHMRKLYGARPSDIRELFLSAL